MTKVTLKKLHTPHQKESFTKFLPLSQAMKEEIFRAVEEIFDAAGGGAMLKQSRDVYIKPNGIDAKAYCFTRPELVEAVVRYWKNHGAAHIYLMENSTQSNYTRIVFAATGYEKICRKYGATPVYLDEEKTLPFEFFGKEPEDRQQGGYRNPHFAMAKTVAEKLVRDRDKNLYIDLPKLKTHSMAGVTLGVKNQWAFPRHPDRKADHNYNLAYKLADVLSYVRPDFTIIEGVEGTVYGHYPVTALAEECIIPFGVLIAGDNVVAVDMVGARLFGLSLEEVPHLRLAVERGYSQGVRSLEDIEIDGDLSPYTKKYPTDLYPSFPPDVKILQGSTLLCKEGCKNNPLTLLQVLYHDYGGRGGWTMVMGKGHDAAQIDAIQGRVLVCGRCAIEEVGDRLVKRLGRKNVYFTGECNDLAASAAAMFHLMRVSPLALVKLNPLVSLKCLLLAKAHGTTSSIPSLVSEWIKTV